MIGFVISEKRGMELFIRGEKIYLEDLSKKLKKHIWIIDGEPPENAKFFSLKEVIEKGLEDLSKLSD